MFATKHFFQARRGRSIQSRVDIWGVGQSMKWQSECCDKGCRDGWLE